MSQNQAIYNTSHLMGLKWQTTYLIQFLELHQNKIAQYMHEKVVHILSYLLYSIDLFIMVQSGLLD